MPLLRFLMKMIKAYPNSDRNLGLEAFKNHVYVQNLLDEQDPSKSSKEKRQNNILDQN
jgi:hypothetical protein